MGATSNNSSTPLLPKNSVLEGFLAAMPRKKLFKNTARLAAPVFHSGQRIRQSKGVDYTKVSRTLCRDAFTCFAYQHLRV
jgi:hypothetical protein